MLNRRSTNWASLLTFRVACTVSIATYSSHQSQDKQRTVLHFEYGNNNIHLPISLWVSSLMVYSFHMTMFFQSSVYDYTIIPCTQYMVYQRVWYKTKVNVMKKTSNSPQRTHSYLSSYCIKLSVLINKLIYLRSTSRFVVNSPLSLSESKVWFYISRERIKF